MTIGSDESFDGLWLYLTGTEPGTCRITASPVAVKAGLCTPAIPSRSPALVDDASLAYLTLRRVDDETTERRWELGAIGHGPTGLQLANRLTEATRIWGQDRSAQPVLTAHPAATPVEQLPAGLAITRRHTQVVIAN